MKHYRVVHHVVERLFWKKMYIMISQIFIYYDTINKDTTLVVSEGSYVDNRKKRIAVNGTLQLQRADSRFGKIGGDFIWFRKRSGVRWTCD